MLKELLEFVVNEKREVRLQALQGLAQFSAKTDNESPKVDDAALLAASLASVYVAVRFISYIVVAIFLIRYVKLVFLAKKIRQMKAMKIFQVSL